MGLAKDEAQGSMVLRMSPPPPTEAKPAKPASLFEGKAEKAPEVPGPIAPKGLVDDLGIFDQPGGVLLDDMGLFDFVGEDHDKMDVVVDGKPVQIRKSEPQTDEAIDLVKAFKEGFASSSTGLAYFEEVPKPRQLVFAEEVSHMFGHILGETPPFALGMMIGGGPVSPLGMGGGFALSTATNKVLRESIQDVNKEMSDYYEGSASPFAFNFNAKEWWEKFNDALKESSKSYVVGATAGAAGKTIGTAAEMAEASSIVKNLASVTGETVAMVQTQAALEGRTPENKEYALTAIAFLGMRAGVSAGKSLAQEIKQVKEFSADTGIEPLKIKAKEYFERYGGPLKNEVGGIEVGGKDPKKSQETKDRLRERYATKDFDEGFKANENNPDQEWVRASSANKMFDEAAAARHKSFRENWEIFKRRFKESFIYENISYRDKLVEDFGKPIDPKKKGGRKKLEGSVAEKAYSSFVRSAGYGKAIEVRLKKYKNKIDRGLDKKEMDDLDKIISANRSIELHANNRAGKAERQAELAEAEKRLEVMKTANRRAFENSVKPIDARLVVINKELAALVNKMESDRASSRGKAFKADITAASKLKKEAKAKLVERNNLQRKTAKKIRDGSVPFAEAIADIKKRILRHDKELKDPNDITLEDYLAFKKKLKETNPLRLEKLEERARLYNSAMREELNILLEEGLLDGESYAKIATKGEYYSLRQYIDTFDPRHKVNQGGMRQVRGSGLHYLDEGAVRKKFNTDHVALMEEVVTRTTRRVMNNRATRELHELATMTSGEKPLIKSDMVYLAEKGEEPPENYVEVFTMIEGKEEPMWVHEDFARAYIREKNPNESTALRTIGWLTGVKMLKATATGHNPLFALFQMARDVQFQTGFNSAYHRNLIKAYGEMGKDMIEVASDTFREKGEFLKAADEGMFQDAVKSVGRLDGGPKHLKTLLDATAYFSEKSEQWIRMAARNRAMRNGVDGETASFRAREMTDFSQIGSATRYLESFIAYLNPAIQPGRITLRTMREDPAKFFSTIGTLGISSAALYFYNTGTPARTACYDSISSGEKAKFFIWCWDKPPTIDPVTNEERYLYTRMPKDQGQQMWTPLFDALAATIIPGRKFDYDQLWEAFLGGLPVSDSSFSPPINDFIGALKNEPNFFGARPWPYSRVEPWAEFTPRTAGGSILAGEVTKYFDEEKGIYKSLPGIGISPARLEGAISTYIASSNPAYKLFGLGGRYLLPENPKAKGKGLGWEDFWNYYGDLPTLGAGRFFRYTRGGNPRSMKSLDLNKREQNTRKLVAKQELERRFKDGGRESAEDFLKPYYDQTTPAAKKMTKTLRRSLNKLLEEETLLKHINTKLAEAGKGYKPLKGEIPNKYFFKKLREESDPIIKANTFYDEYKLKTPWTQKIYDILLEQDYLSLGEDRQIFYDQLEELKQGKGQ